MASLNRVMLIGNVGKLESRTLPNSDLMVNFSLACSESWKDSNGDKQEKTEWISCIAYRKLADIINQYVQVGNPLYVEGKFETKQWKDKEGKTCYKSQIVVNDMKMLGGRKSGDAPKPEGSHKGYASNKRGPEIDEDLPF